VVALRSQRHSTATDQEGDMKTPDARETFGLADDEQLLHENRKLATWLKGGRDVSRGHVVVTDSRLIFKGYAPRAAGQGVVVDAAANKILSARSKAKGQVHEFSIDLAEITGGAPSKSSKLQFGGNDTLDIATADGTYRLARIKDFEPQLKEALAARGRTISENGVGGWTAS
jgi:hypothetical protein